MKKIGIEIKWAIIFAVVSLLWMFLEKSMGLHGANIEKHALITNFFAIPAIAIFVLALLDKRKNHYGGKITWMQGFLTGLVITAFVAVLTPLTQYVTHMYISPDYFTNAINFAVDNGKMELQQAQEFFNLRSYIFQSALGGVVMGLITSAIVAIFIRKK